MRKPPPAGWPQASASLFYRGALDLEGHAWWSMHRLRDQPAK